MTRQSKLILVSATIAILWLLFLAYWGITKTIESGHKNSNSGTDTVTVLSVKHDTVPGQPVLSHSEVTIHDTVWPTTKVDTAAILAQFYTQKIYHREYLDTSVCIHMIDTVYKNGLFPGPLSTEIYRKTYTIDRTITRFIEPRIGFDAGLQITNAGIAMSLGAGVYHNSFRYSAGAIVGTFTGLNFQISKTLNERIKP